MSRLERRCRRLLRAYPEGYRRWRGEEVLGVLMDGAPPGRDRPRLRDAADVVACGAARRLLWWTPAALVSVLRVASPLAAALGAGYAAAWLFAYDLLPHFDPAVRVVYEGPPFPTAPFPQSAAWWAYLPWIAAFGALLGGRARAARALTAAALVTQTAIAALQPSTTWVLPTPCISAALIGFGLIAVLAPADAAPRSGWPRRGLLLLAAAPLAGELLLRTYPAGGGYWLARGYGYVTDGDVSSRWTVLVPVLLVIVLVGLGGADARWMFSAAFLAGPLLMVDRSLPALPTVALYWLTALAVLYALCWRIAPPQRFPDPARPPHGLPAPGAPTTG